MTAVLTHDATQAKTAQPVTPAGRGLWHRIRQTVREMNCAARRVTELQAPWSVDQHWQSR